MGGYIEDDKPEFDNWFIICGEKELLVLAEPLLWKMKN
jgi:hypothetical protein